MENLSVNPENYKILVVDDIATNVLLLKTILGKAGYRIVTATGGREALEKVESESPDLILLDIMMPDMNGYEVIERLKADERFCRIPVIFLSALHDSENIVKGFKMGAFPYAEVISGYTAFYLGAKSVCPSVTMEVKYTNSWASFDLEKECADALISDGCVLISQHADTTGAPTACEAAGVPCVGYNIDMTSVAPNTALTSASMDWGVYYTYAVQCMLDGTAIDTDWCKGFAEGADKITALNDKTVAEGTEEKVKEVEDALIDGSLHVFDTSAFTVDGKELDTYKKGDTEYISDGYFHESEYGSAPAFDIAIDGITSITE